MLKKLTVSNLAIVEKTEAEFCHGLNVITGETGAGKSVLMGALELVLGGRADALIVRDGATEAEVEADFGEIILRRTVTAQGRSRAWINDESVTVAELRERAQGLVDVHGPTANLSLVEESYQRDTLDAFGELHGADGALAVYRAQWEKFESLRARVEALEAQGGADELDLLRYQVNELDAAELTEEDATLAERHAAAAHAQEIVAAANSVTEALGGDQSVTEILRHLQPSFHEMARHLPLAAEWQAQAEDLAVRAEDLSRAVANEVSRLDVDSEDFAVLDSRLTTINRLLRKYRVVDVNQLLSLAETKRAKLDDLEHREERLEALRGEIAAVESQVRKAGLALTKARRALAKRFSSAVTNELRDLGFLRAEFTVAMESCEPSSTGMDRVVYMFGPNPGEEARPLSAIASSGEIARVMLALKVVMSSRGNAAGASTLVFDEIDANIGGEVGKIVGEKLKAVAQHHQVIAITHLPQSAAYGERHFVMLKVVSKGRTRTGISVVEGEDRVSELARMLGGEKLTSVVRKHAEELLQLSH